MSSRQRFSQWRYTKVDIVRDLSRAFGYRHYLEIATTTTGFRFASARTFGFETCMRLMYRCPPSFADGHPIEFRSSSLDISSCLAVLRNLRLTFDIVLVDPHHTYECSARDLRVAFSLIRHGGAVVVHDCDPPSRQRAAPDYYPGPWCGVTYKAYIDFVLANDRLAYCTVDTDWGCGIILKKPIHGPIGLARAFREHRAYRRQQLIQMWCAVGSDFEAAYDLFAKEKTSLLHLIPINEFRQGLCIH